MAEIFEFLMKHWMLSGAMVVAIILFVANEIKAQSGAKTKVSPGEAVNLMNHEKAVIIDVRSVDGYKDGHIVDSKNIPLSDLDDRLSSIQQPKDKPVIVVCDQGLQSNKAVAKLKSGGYEKVYFMQGGMNSWKAENLPLTKKD